MSNQFLHLGDSGSSTVKTTTNFNTQDGFYEKSKAFQPLPMTLNDPEVQVIPSSLGFVD